jgi:hypothetical protein
MTLLSHDLERSSCTSAHHDLRRRGLTQSQRTTLKNLAFCALTLLVSGGALAAVIALRTVIYVSRLNLGAG